MKRFLIGLLALFVTSAAFGQPSVRVEGGPYLQGVTENGFTVVWTTNMDSIAWVEIAPEDGTHFYAVERPKHYDSKIGKMHMGKLHRVRVEGLEAGTTYRYRIMQRGIVLNDGDKRVILGEGKGSNPYQTYEVTTLDPTKKSTEFWVVNDIHARDSIFRRMMDGIGESKADFVVFNGDMVSSMESEKQIYAGYLQAASDILTKAGLPIFAVRGNHETRGAFAENYLEYFPTTTGEAYYTFRQGPAYFIMLDCGEDKPDDDIEYFGLDCTASYREKEAVWLKEVVESEEYRAAPIHIVIIHMPPGGENGWYGENEIKRLFVPTLNKAGIDIMLCGHYHRYQWIDKNSRGTNFPILVNSNNDKLIVDVDETSIGIDVVNTDGAVIKHHSIQK